MAAQKRYGSIIDLPHHSSPTRPRMDPGMRAAQFAPFAALTGYDAVIEESGRYTNERRELSGESVAELNRTLLELSSIIHERPEVIVTYFRPDEHKKGGAYVSFIGKLKKIDSIQRCLVFQDDKIIPIDDIYQIEEASSE